METLRTLSGWLEERLLWIVVTGVSWPLGLVIALIIAKSTSLVLPREVSLVMGGAAGGALIGFVQWLFLRPEVKGVGLWILATAVGWIAGLVAATLTVMVADLALGWIIGGVLGGSVFSLAQGLILRPEAKVRREWMLVMAASWPVALGSIQGSGGSDMLTDVIVEVAISGAAGLAIVGILAASALVLVFPKFWKKIDITAHIRRRT